MSHKSRQGSEAEVAWLSSELRKMESDIELALLPSEGSFKVEEFFPSECS